MAGAGPSFAQSLRVIGQDLEGLGVKAFELGKVADDYVVDMDCHGPERKLRDKSLLTRITKKIHGVNDPPVPNPLRFTTEQIVWADIERGSHRGQSGGVPDAGKLSLVLRVLGNFLDEREASEFTICWSSDGARVSYDRKVESFTNDNLYDLGVRMYLRRSNRVPVR